MGLKELLLNKGWAGKTLSRKETADRINPIIRRHYELNHSYEFVIKNIGDLSAAERLNVLQKTARVDIGKLSETVLSAGFSSYNGTDLEPQQFDLGTDDAEMIRSLQTLETDFEKMLAAELELEHQIRTRAVLTVVQGNSRDRLEALRSIARDYRAPARAE